MLDNPHQANDWSERYKFRQLLGQGGMGVIYLAENKQKNNALCVIKQLILQPTNKHEHAESIRLFKREAELLQSLNHPGIVRLFDSHASADGQYFLVMDYLPGKTLDEILKQQGAFSAQAAVEIGIQCCEVLEYLHRHNPPIIYRDLKPSNLMLTPEGLVTFIDFGIARIFVSRETATRVITTGYSPPEQYFGKPEFRSDLYSFGATLGQLLTAVKPKPLVTSSPRKINAQILASLDNLIKRLTAQEVEDRPPSAQFVRYELYHIYHEIDPNFAMPEDAIYTDWRRQPAVSVMNRVNAGKQNAAQRQNGLQNSLTAAKTLWQKLFSKNSSN